MMPMEFGIQVIFNSAIQAFIVGGKVKAVRISGRAIRSPAWGCGDDSAGGFGPATPWTFSFTLYIAG
ncbi:MAG: hypothetical protein IPK21_21560 [Haliscomenobacter sp.]|nr:hypothetical protein [Haliscomenobacter sp.]